MEYDERYKKYNVGKYADKYSEQGLFDKITGSVKKAGLSVIYKALQLFYVAKNPNVPMKIRAAIIAPLGYFISPVDLIPDLMPVVGFGDDAAVIALAMAAAHMYITEDVKQRAKDTIRKMFGESAISELD
ncbi:MAG: DUF1232 domain-containing protein [Selenomonadaceae bacterium]|nr:DUF1232 domain-containing protein [Selenomonadaceae bacterium]